MTVVDYGIGNLLSVARAFEHCGAEVDLSRDPRAVEAAGRLVVPGVGAFGDCMAALRSLHLVEPIRAHAASGRPWLGICVGMQMMVDAGEEFGEHEGLGLIPGRCVPIPGTTAAGLSHKIPHIGWNALEVSGGSGAWSGTLLADTAPGTAVYFVHSFAAEPRDPRHRLADADYNGRRIPAALRRDNLVGTQFHPEKSGPAGHAMIRAFLAL